MEPSAEPTGATDDGDSLRRAVSAYRYSLLFVS